MMKKILLRLFRRKTPHIAASPCASLPLLKDNPVSIQEGSENALRRQLVQMVLHDMLRKHGIVESWLDCQVVAVFSRSRGHGVFARLVVTHWDDRLMKYAFAFQTDLIASLRRFEPQAENWLHGISWQLEVKDSCPYTIMPEPSFWQEKPVSVPTKRGTQAKQALTAQTVSQAPTPQAIDLETRQAENDLERLFAIRDRELGLASQQGLQSKNYEKTQPVGLM